MEAENLIAKASITIDASIDTVWDAFVNPETIKKYMFGTTVTSEWKEGQRISWKGEWKGKPYEDYGEILQINPKVQLQYSHYSPMMGKPDLPENYHVVTIDLKDMGGPTLVTLTQDNNATAEAKEQSEQNWKMMFEKLKKLLENK